MNVLVDMAVVVGSGGLAAVVRVAVITGGSTIVDVVGSMLGVVVGALVCVGGLNREIGAVVLAGGRLTVVD